MAAGRYDFGSDDPVPIDLNFWIARMMIRAKMADPTPLVSLTTDAGGGIQINLPNIILVTITDEQTAPLDFGRGFWDIELEAPDGHVVRLLNGRVKLSKEVTR
jgi:hypothetical protein